LNCECHGRMWNVLATILESSESDDIHTAYSQSRACFSNNAMTFILLPTVRSLLLERADAGDIQSCVVLCEVMEIVFPQKTLVSRQQKFKNTLCLDLDINLVCEWYLSYINLLQQMCMFSYATELIKYSRILYINNLNQQSTTVTESCANCSKPLQDVTIISETDHWGQEIKSLTAQKTCKNCRQRLRLCFLCHQPVMGVFAWCPGCGHGGHLEHALEWFGASNIYALQGMCPTGCGHKCRMVGETTTRSFPIIEYLR